MRTTTVRRTIMVPEAISDTAFVVRDATLEVTFHVYPGEAKTRDYPGSPPEAEYVESQIEFPDGNRRQASEGSVWDIVSDEMYSLLHETAIRQAAEEAKEEAECAAEERWEREQDEGR